MRPVAGAHALAGDCGNRRGNPYRLRGERVPGYQRVGDLAARPLVRGLGGGIPLGAARGRRMRRPHHHAAGFPAQMASPS